MISERFGVKLYAPQMVPPNVEGNRRGAPMLANKKT
jgi:hypothetical protein